MIKNHRTSTCTSTCIDDRVANEILLHNVNDNIDCRISSDSVLNEQGKKLLSLCNAMNLRIANGRFGEDSAKFTCRDSSVVDYALLSPSLFNEVLSLKVDMFDPMLSDVHNTLNLNLHCSIFHCVEEDVNEYVNSSIAEQTTEQGSKDGCSNKRAKWKKQMSNNFYECLKQLDIDKLNNDLNAVLNSNSIDKSDIDSMSARLSSMFVSGAKDCNMILIECEETCTWL